MRFILVALLGLALAGPAAAQSCHGDCDGNGSVSVDELILAVDIALDAAGVGRCAAADRDGNGVVTVNELIAAVDAALRGCPMPTPTVTVTPNPDLCADVPSFPGVAATTVRITGDLVRPVTITAPPRDVHRVFVLEQDGRIRIIKDDVLLPDAFLSIEDRVSCCGERGLLGLAFPPDYDTTGWFFVDYTDNRGDTVVARYQVSAADPDRADRDSERVLIGIDQPFANHNGGQLAFGPDGYLYVGMGDGGSGGDPFNNAQNDDELLGKLLRMDVRVPPESTALYTVPPSNPHPERGERLGLIWAKGLRNPWRFGFDRVTGDLYIADVGQGDREEIDIQPASSPGGENYGWRIFEGFNCFNPAPARVCPDPLGFTMPVLDYGHDAGRCSITGGYVYRGCALPDLRGHYLFADFCTHFFQSFRYVDGVITGLRDRTAELAPGSGQSIDQVSTFGEDGRGEIYIGDYDGEIYKIVPAQPAP